MHSIHALRSKVLQAVLLTPLVLVAAGRAESMPLVQEMALHSMLESTTSVYTTLRDYAVLNPDGISDGTGSVAAGSAITWSGSFSNAGWTYSASGVFSGMALSMNYAGVVTGSNASDVVVTITGSGSLGGVGSLAGLGSQPLAMNALSTWYFNSPAQDYLDMDFEQSTKIGANSHYGRVKGKEKIICVLDGHVVGGGKLPPVVAGSPVELVGDASSGKKSYPTGNGYVNGTKECHLAPVELTSVASSGKRGIATVSTVVVSLLSSGGFSVLAFPAAVAPAHEFDPSNMGTVVAVDGGLYADDARNQFRSTGQYLDNGNFSGTLTAVPEPGSAWLVAMALALLAGATATRTLRTPVGQGQQKGKGEWSGRTPWGRCADARPYCLP